LTAGLRTAGDTTVIIPGACTNSLPDEVRALPGVTAAACTGPQIYRLYGSRNGAFVLPASGIALNMGNAEVDYGFFEMYGLSPIAGRLLSREFADTLNPDTGSGNVVINEAAVRALGFSSASEAVGRAVNGRSGDWHRVIVGVVPDFPMGAIYDPVEPTMFPIDPRRTDVLTVKIAGEDLPAVLQSIDEIWKAMGPPRPMLRFFRDQYFESLYLTTTRQLTLFTWFSGIAIFVAGLGLFGLAAFTAERRTKEIGIRKSMGASTADILRLILWQFTKPVLWANLIAWPAAYLVMQRWLAGFAYHIDLAPWTFLAASALAVVIAIATVIGHALAVARAQPVHALRYE
jgi:putative ABC transport system permease protein